MLNRTLETVPLVDPAQVGVVTPKLPKAHTETNANAMLGGSEYSVVNERLILRGDLESDADILVKGKVFGNIRCKLLIIDVGARVEGAISAQDVIVRGSTKGSILAHRVRLEKTADVASDIHHASFCAEEGARIRGVMDYSDAPLKSLAASGFDYGPETVSVEH